MTLIRTTLQPTQVIDVDERELWRLTRLGLVFGNWRALYVNFFIGPGGPTADNITGLTVTVRNSSNQVVLSASGGSIEHIAAGAWLYRVPAATTLPAGTYQVTWSGTDSEGNTASAVESVTVEA